MIVELVAVGTELLLGQIVDTNSAYLGERLADQGFDHTHTQIVGDNLDRMVQALTLACSRADAVIVCGGLGPTQDDITREAIAATAGVQLRRDERVAARIAEMFASRNRTMVDSNLRQADVPEGATVIEQRIGTAPGLVCPALGKVMYAVPGVPYELEEMFERGVLPDLRARAGRTGVIRSRVLRTWGLPESTLAEMLDPRLADLQQRSSNASGQPVPTIAFLASGWDGIKVRLTVKAGTEAEAAHALDAEDAQVRSILGDVVFGVNDQSMQSVVGELLVAQRHTIAFAESLTAGLAAGRCADVPGASAWLRGGVVAYSSDVKFDVLGVSPGQVVTAACAEQLADAARRVLNASVGVGLTGVAGPEPVEGHAPGTVFLGLSIEGRPTTSAQVRLPGDRMRVRQLSVISALDMVRRALSNYPS